MVGLLMTFFKKFPKIDGSIAAKVHQSSSLTRCFILAMPAER
jgi:hypothetical protein